jgi:hypothetical protein
LNAKLLALSVIILLTITTIYSATITPVKAATGTGDWITKYRIEDSTGNLILDNNIATGATSGSGQISAGQELKVTVTINIATSNPSSSLSLSTALAHSASKDHYWEHDSGDGYSLGSYNPNSASFSFSQAAGTLTISCYGVASGTVATTVSGVTLHKAVPVSLVALKDPSGSTLDEIKRNITDASINSYNLKLKEQQNKLASLSSSGVSPGYVELFSNVVDQSQVMAGQGFTDSAVALLDGLNVAQQPASATMEILFIPLIAIFAVIAGVFGFLFMRIRGKVSYYQLVVEDQIKDLEGLSIRAAKIDRTFSSNLESVKDRLKRLVGM